MNVKKTILPKRAPARNARLRRPAREEAPARPKMFGSVDWGRMRLWGVGVVFTLLWMGLWARAFQLQIIQGPDLAVMAKRQQMATELIQGVRGSILDRNSNVMARSVDCRSAWVNPHAVSDKQATAAALARILDMPAGKILSILQENRRFVWLKRKLDYETAETVRKAALPGVHLETEFERVYPYRHLAGQLLGFVNIDDQGLEGLEKAFDGVLGGKKVRQAVERDASGRRMMLPDTEDPGDLRGRNVRLTIDTQVQFFAEEALAENVEKFGANWGGCIVVDVPSGEVLAWAQYPFFNPNNAGKYSGAVKRNRLAMDSLEQGSTIKSFLIAAALEEKVVTPSTVINCEKGQWKLKSATIHDTHPYANLTVDQILHVSSNIGAAKIGMKLGVNKYREYLMRLGFGERTGLPLAGEAPGIFRSTRQWAEIDLAAASFGQSFSATLVQMAQAYLCLASDGAKKPLKLVLDDGVNDYTDGLSPESVAAQNAGGQEEDRDQTAVSRAAAVAAPAPERIFSPQTMVQVRGMLREVVEEEGGTGSQARIPGMVVGGKTGTAQKADKSGRYGSGRVGSFVGMVPIENPRYLICVLLDEPTKNQYGGVVAAPVFRHVALQTMAYHGLLPDTDDPLVRAVAEKEAARKARSGGKPGRSPQVFTMASGRVNPQAGQAAAAGGTAASAQAASAKAAGDKTRAALEEFSGGRPAPAARAASGPGPAGTGAQGPGASGPDSSSRAGREAVAAFVPAVVGMGVRGAVEAFAVHGVMPAIKGKGGFVVKQSPEAGVPWPAGKKECILWLEERAS